MLWKKKSWEKKSISTKRWPWYEILKIRWCWEMGWNVNWWLNYSRKSSNCRDSNSLETDYVWTYESSYVWTRQWYEDMIDHRRYAHNLSSCEIKAARPVQCSCHFTCEFVIYPLEEKNAFAYMKFHIFQLRRIHEHMNDHRSYAYNLGSSAIGRFMLTSLFTFLLICIRFCFSYSNKHVRYELTPGS